MATIPQRRPWTLAEFTEHDRRIEERFSRQYEEALAKIEAEEASGTLAARLERYETSPIIRRIGGWAITTYGIECLYDYYPIEKDRINAEDDWVVHLSEKASIARRSLRDFTACHDAVRNRTCIKGGLRRRFAVLKRDGYRCQLCGATAEDGARLEVDHRIPRAKGGPDHEMNLWTLCFDCNRGKSDSDL